jgi:endonuclease/exonuclease/phosphatase family metal-dependent hydrolase
MSRLARRRMLCALALPLVACVAPATMQRATPPSGSFCPPVALVVSGGGAATDRVADTALRWYRAVEERDRTLAARWCATVGPPVVRLEPRSGQPAWERGDGVEVVTWNTYLGGGDLIGFLRARLGLDCDAPTGDSARRARPFVLLLQEVFRRAPDLPHVGRGPYVPWMMGPDDIGPEVPDVVDVAERCGLSLVYVPSARNGADTGPRPGEDKGNAILATLPLSDPLALDLPLEAGRKVGVAATVRAPGGELVRFVSVHLDVASTFVRTLLSGNQTRARQAAGLIDGLAQAEAEAPEIDATVVGSDLNTWTAEDAAVRLMQSAFPDSPDPDRFGTRGSYPTDHLHLRHRPGVDFELAGYRRMEEAYGSDHVGRRATLRYGR